ncbi:hypothetical protein D3C80_1348770 [compost metagenome]
MKAMIAHEARKLVAKFRDALPELRIHQVVRQKQGRLQGAFCLRPPAKQSAVGLKFGLTVVQEVLQPPERRCDCRDVGQVAHVDAHLDGSAGATIAPAQPTLRRAHSHPLRVAPSEPHPPQGLELRETPLAWRPQIAVRKT